MKRILNGFQILVIWLITAFCAIFGLILIPFVGQKKSISISSWLWCRVVLGVSGVKVLVEGVENLNHKKAVIYTANHESAFDIPVIFKAIPQPLFYLAKAELKKIPFFGWYVNAVGMVFVDRKNKAKSQESLRKAGDEIRKGKNIISFPEGTRSITGEIMMFKRGSFILSLANNIDIVPVAIIGTKNVNPPGYSIQSGIVRVVIGAPIEVYGWDKERPDDLAKYVEERVRHMVTSAII